MPTARQTLPALSIPSHVNLGWLGKSAQNWGKIIQKNGDRETGALAIKLGFWILTMQQALSGEPNLAIAHNAADNAQKIAQTLRKRMRHLHALKAFGRILEDIESDVLRPTGRRACQTRVAARFSNQHTARMRMDRNRIREMFDNGGYLSVWTGPKAEEKMREYGLEIPPPKKSGPVYYKGKKVGFMDNWAGLKLQDESFVLKHMRFLEGFNWMYTNG